MTGSQPHHVSATRLYRTYLKFLQHLPDPHAWSILQPRFRGYLERAYSQLQNGSVAEGSQDAVKRQLAAKRAEKLAAKELKKLHMAVSSYPHALTRLLDDVYGQHGAVRWRLLNSVLKSTPDFLFSNDMTVPACLMPLLPGAAPQRPASTAAGRLEVKGKKAKSAERLKQWRDISVPIVMPATSPTRTGWESRGVVESLRVLAGLGDESRTSTEHATHEPEPCAEHSRSNLWRDARTLPTFRSLRSGIQGIIPHRRPAPLIPYPPPPARATRQNPQTWSAPRQLTPRLVQRTYRRLWDKLVWVRPLDSGDRWVRCSYSDLNGDSAGINSQQRISKGESQLPDNKATLGREIDQAWL